MKKYELTKNKFEFEGKILYQIRALKDFRDVKKGDLGGFVASEANLSQEDGCWIHECAKVFDEAKVYYEAKILENAQVFGEAKVFGWAKISGNAIVCDNAQVYGYACVCMDAQVYGKAKVYGKAYVYGKAKVYGNAKVHERAHIFDSVEVCGDAQVCKSTLVYDKNHIPVVIEVKRSLANISAVHQLRMYVSDIKKNVDNANVRGILCAPRIPDMVKKLLSDYNLEWQEVERRVILPDDFQKTLREF